MIAVIAALLTFVQRLLGRSDIYFMNKLYMRRWRVLHFKSFGVRVHCIERDDHDRELHDHPFSFVSVILNGGYIEHRPFGVSRKFTAPAIVRRKAEDLHRLELVNGPTWTLVFRGPLRREWGFMTERGWRNWRDFVQDRAGVVEEDRPFAAISSTGMRR